MLQLGIVKEILLDENKLIVRIPILEYTGDREVLMKSPICHQPGNTYGYKVEDVVLIGFINDDYNCPIVIGKMFTEKETNPTNGLAGNSLNIDGSTVLGENTKIGQITYDDIYVTVKQFKEVAPDIDRLTRSIENVATDTPELNVASEADVNNLFNN